MGSLSRLARCVVLLAGGVAAALASADELRVGSSGDYPPFSEQTPAAESEAGAPARWDGFDVALARAYAQERGLELVFVPFRWPALLADLHGGRFDVALSGITVRPERSLAGRFGVPVAESGAVVLVRDEGRFAALEDLDRRDVRIGVNAGGHLERVAQARFSNATLVLVPGNDAVLPALLEYSVDAIVTDSVEAPLWRAQGDLVQLGPFSQDRKAPLFHPERGALAADFDAWLLAREADGSLAALRRRYLGEAAGGSSAEPVRALLAALDERLALMPLVAAAKRKEVRPIEDPTREAKVIEAGVAGVLQAARRRRVPAPDAAAVRSFFAIQIETARRVQLRAVRDPAFAPESIPDLEDVLRPALLRIGERIAELIVALPAAPDAAAVVRASQTELRAERLDAADRDGLAKALLAVARAPRAEPLVR